MRFAAIAPGCIAQRTAERYGGRGLDRSAVSSVAGAGHHAAPGGRRSPGRLRRADLVGEVSDLL